MTVGADYRVVSRAMERRDRGCQGQPDAVLRMLPVDWHTTIDTAMTAVAHKNPLVFGL